MTPRDPAAMTFTENGARKIVVCVADSGGVWINSWNGFQWSWLKYLKGGVVVDTVAGAVTYQVDGTRRIAVVMRAQGGNIWLMNLVNGTFGWTSLGQP